MIITTVLTAASLLLKVRSDDMLELLSDWLIILLWIIAFMSSLAICGALMYVFGKTICLLIDEIQNQKKARNGSDKKDDTESESDSE